MDDFSSVECVREDRKLLQERISVIAIHQGEARRIVGRDGSKLNWLIDLRAVFMDPAALRAIANLFWARYAETGPIQIAGMEVAAIPLVSALVLEGAHRGRIASGLIIRKERKATGLGQAVEGSITGDPIILVDDLINSGESTEKARASLNSYGSSISEIFVVIDYKSEKGISWRNNHNIQISSLFELHDFGLKLHSRTAPSLNRYEPLWRYRPGTGRSFSAVPKSQPVFMDDTLLFGTCSGAVVSVDVASGEERWRVQLQNTGTKGIWSSFAIHEGRAYFGAYNGIFYSLDARTGREIWTNSACEWIGSSPTVVERHRLVVVGLEYERLAARGSMAAFALSSGDKVWEYELREYQHGSAIYWDEGDLIVCGTNDHTILALRAGTGEKVWEYATTRSIKYRPSIDPVRRLVITASFDGTIRANRLETGELIGQVRTADICYTTPLVCEGRIYCGSGDRNLYIIDLDSFEIIKKIQCRSRVYSSPIMLDNSVIAGSNGGIVREWDRASLELRGWLAVPDAVTNSVVVRGDTIIVPTYMNELYAFRRHSV